MVPNTCTVDVCSNQHLAKGLCLKHYNRVRRTGTTNPRHRPSAIERFWPRVNKTSTCWLWTGSTGKYGHGLFKLGDNNVPAYRFAWEQIRGPIPEGKVLDHLCRVPQCVNPEHLEPTSSGENVLRGIGPGALNKRKTHCKQGHAFAGTNLRISPDGSRVCRECERQKIKRRRSSAKAKLSMGEGTL